MEALDSGNGMDMAGQGFERRLKEFPTGLPVGFVHELGDGEFARAVEMPTNKYSLPSAV